MGYFLICGFGLYIFEEGFGFGVEGLQVGEVEAGVVGWFEDVLYRLFDLWYIETEIGTNF